MSAADSNFTTITHGSPYAAISPSRDELSQKGNTVLITGSSSGIGFAIASSFAQANATKVILTGRRQEALDEAIQKLSHGHPQTRFVSYPVDICDTASVEELWSQLEEEKEIIHVLVLNACKLQKAGDIMSLGYQEMWSSLVGNVGSHMLFAERFYNQKVRQEKQKLVRFSHTGVDARLIMFAQTLVNVSSAAIHRFDLAAHLPGYATVKNSGTLLLQQIAADIGSDDMQIVSFHPGAIFTSAARDAGYDKTAMNWDDGECLLVAVLC